MSELLTILIIIASLILILVVLVQNSKGGGLSSQFSSSNQVMGVKKTSEVIEKITWGLVIAIFVLCLALSFSLKSAGTTGPKDTELREELEKANNAQPLKNVPGAAKPTSPAPAPAPAQ
jgi:preprotein translocase subunit SecG